MPSIKDRTITDEAAPISDILPTAPSKIPPTWIPTVVLGPTGSPIPRRGSPPNEYLFAGKIEEANPDSPYFQGIAFPPAIAEADAPAQLVVGTPVVPTPSFEGAALPVGGILVTESPYKAAPSGLYSLVSVAFNRVLSDTLFGYVNIWVKGYHGSSVPELVASGTTSPISFLLETTGETVTIYASTISISGVPNLVTSSPFQAVLLDGVTSAPPAPSVTQTLVGMPTGYQFTFSQLAGILADIISGYNIYRNTSNTTVGATVIRFIPQSALNSGSFVFQDALNDAVVYYYWVSAVNTSGLESALTSAQTGAISGSLGSVPPIWSAGFTYDSPIPGTSATIYWDGTFGSTTITIYRADGTTTGPLSGNQAITGLTASTTYYIYPYYDEVGAAIAFSAGGTGTPNYAFTAPNFVAAQTQGLRNHTPLSSGAFTLTTGSGGGGSSGGSSRCVMEGSKIEALSGECHTYLWPQEEWIRITTANGCSISCTPNHPVYTNNGKTRVDVLTLGEYIITKQGFSPVVEIKSFSLKARKISIVVPDGELYWANDILSSNMKEPES